MAPYGGVGMRKAGLMCRVADWPVRGMGLAFLAFTRIPGLSAGFDTKAPTEWGLPHLSY
jgi:hypothetical protein